MNIPILKMNCFAVESQTCFLISSIFTLDPLERNRKYCFSPHILFAELNCYLCIFISVNLETRICRNYDSISCTVGMQEQWRKMMLLLKVLEIKLLFVNMLSHFFWTSKGLSRKNWLTLLLQFINVISIRDMCLLSSLANVNTLKLYMLS